TGLINGHWAFEGRFSNIHSDGYIDRATSNMQSYFGQGGYFSKNTVLKFITFGGTEHTYHAWNGVPKDSLTTHRTYNPSGYMGTDASGNPLYYKNQTDNYTQNHYKLILSHVINPNLSLNAALFLIKGKGYYEEYKDSVSESSLGKILECYGLKSFEYNGKIVSIRDRIQQKWLDNDFGGVVFSLNYKMNKLDATFGGGANRYVGYSFGKNMWVKDYFTVDPNYNYGQEFYRSKGDKYDANLYVKANYQLTKELSAYADLQYRYIDYTIKGTNDKFDWNIYALQPLDIHKQFNFFNPKAGLFYQIDKNSQAYASVSVAHREPTRNNFTDAVNSIEPTSERLIDYEAGYTFANKTFTVGANLYFMDYKNQLILNGQINAVGEALTTNIPESYRAGIELMAGVKITDWLKWTGNATLSQNRIKNFTEYVDNFDANWTSLKQEEHFLGTTPIAFSPNLTAASIISADYRKWSAGLMSNYVGKQYIDNTGNNDRSLNAYFVNNLRVGYVLNPKAVKELGFSILVNNIFNVKYESNAWVYSYYYDGVRYASDGYFPQAGTNVLANVTLKF
ncbi:MAG: TonB-dependent receptor, partial [Bacteroidota bacterium]|nr:TonB-dependent receptor [Bacteroidota bacterium]